MKNINALTGPQKTQTLLAIALVVIAALAAMANFPRFLDAENAKRLGDAVDAVAVAQAAVLDADLDKFQTALNKQIQSLNVASVLSQAEGDAYQVVANNLQQANADSGVVQVRLIPMGNNYSDMGLRFSQLDRLTSAEHGVTIYPEAFEAMGKKQFDFLLSVKNAEGKLLGFVLVVADDRVFKDDLSKMAQETGNTLLVQKFSTGNAQVVFGTGEKQSEQSASNGAKTSVPHWKVVVVPSAAFIQTHTISVFWLYIADVIVLAISVFVLLFLNRKAATVVKKIEAEHTTPIQIKGARKVDKEEFAAANTAQANSDGELMDPLFQSSDVFDLDLDDDILGLGTAKTKPASAVKAAVATDSFAAPAAIFRDYDIRGNADADLADELALRIGRAFGSECVDRGHTNVVLAGDGRLSTPRLKEAVLKGLLQSGCAVVDVGMVPTPLMNFATNTISGFDSGMMVTASHNPADDNGFKMVIGGHTLAGDEIQRIRERVQNGEFYEAETEGEHSEQEMIDAYIDHVVSDVVLAGSYKVVVDCGNGVASVVAPRLLEELGCDVVPLFCDVDGSFPNHQPDPSELSNLDSLIAAVKNEGADIGIAFDGDGDRLAVVSASGQIILPDCLLMLFAKDVVSRNPGTDIVFDVKSTRRLNALISGCGGRPVICKSGHSHIRNKMVETGAMLGGELSGHIFFKERWFGFDDGIYSAVRLLELMSIRDQDLDSIFAEFPASASTPEIRIAVPEDKKFSIVKQLENQGEWGNGKLSDLDGVRIDFAKGWGLVRASNTSAALTLRFEADDAEALATVQNVFKQQLLRVDSSLTLPF